MTEIQRRIKQKEDAKIPIKKLDRKALYKQKLKNNIGKTKENVDEKENNNPNEYSINKIIETEKGIYHRGIVDLEKYAKKAVKETKQNANYTVQKIKQKKSNKTIKRKAKETTKRLKQGRKTIKTSKRTGKFAYKTTKQTEKIAIKTSKKAYQGAKEGTKATIKGIKIGVKATIKAVKTTVVTAKSMLSLFLAGGWIAFVVILVLCIVGMACAMMFGESTEQNSSIVAVAMGQVGNVGGEKFWKWYGFNEHVEWCAIFVSWCANECGYIESGTIPKFSSCKYEGVPFFKEKGLWKDRGYIAKSGDIIFFDWEQDGLADHVGIVQKTENDIVYTIEGNSSGDTCRQKEYNINSNVIYGYGTPLYLTERRV